MDFLREFLESSNIHGLFYISTAKVSRQISLIKITTIREVEPFSMKEEEALEK